MMKRLKIVFVDGDARYLEPLTERFGIELGVDNIDVTVITESSSFDNYFSQMRDIDIMLINRNMYSDRLSMHNIKNMFLLSETETAEPNVLYKYTGTKDIYDHVYSNIEPGLTGDMGSEKESKIISVYSPVGGCGKTVAALTLAQALSDAGESVLFVSGEDIPSFNTEIESEGVLDDGFKTDILNGVEVSRDKLSGYIGSCGFDYILPVKRTLFSEGYSFKDMVRVSIMTKKLYNYVVFDMPSVLNADICGFLLQADRNIIVAEQSLPSAMKLDRLLSAIDYKSGGKYAFVCNKFDKTKKNYLNDEYMTNRIGIRITFEQCDKSPLYKALSENVELKEYLKYIL